MELPTSLNHRWGLIIGSRSSTILPHSPAEFIEVPFCKKWHFLFTVLISPYLSVKSCLHSKKLLNKFNLSFSPHLSYFFKIGIFFFSNTSLPRLSPIFVRVMPRKPCCLKSNYPILHQKHQRNQWENSEENKTTKTKFLIIFSVVCFRRRPYALPSSCQVSFWEGSYIRAIPEFVTEDNTVLENQQYYIIELTCNTIISNSS